MFACSPLQQQQQEGMLRSHTNLHFTSVCVLYVLDSRHSSQPFAVTIVNALNF